MEQASAMLFPLITLMTNLKQFKSHFGGSPSPSLLFFSSSLTLLLLYSSFTSPFFSCLSSLFHLHSSFSMSQAISTIVSVLACVCACAPAAHSSVLNIQSEAERERVREGHRRCYAQKHMQQQEADWSLLIQTFLRGRRSCGYRSDPTGGV